VRGGIGIAALRSPSEADSLARRIGPGGWIGRDSPFWLVLVAGLFTLAELTPSLMRLPLGADEVTYIAQTSAHVSQVILPPVHSRGAGLLAAPVTLLTTSLLALRIWMALLSGTGLFLALLTWRGIRPAWVLAVAGAILGSLGIAQLSAVQAMPDWWVALGALALTGLFLQAVTGRMRPKVILPLLAAGTFFLVLMRPQDAAFLLVPVIAAVFLVPAWWDHRVLYAIGIGIVAAGAEWIGEAYAWYGGPNSRLHMMGQEPPKFGFYFTLPYQLRVLNGPWYCRPGEYRLGLSLADHLVGGAACPRDPGRLRGQTHVAGLVGNRRRARALAAHRLHPVRSLRRPPLPASGDRPAGDPCGRRDRLAQCRVEVAGSCGAPNLCVPAGWHRLPAIRAGERGR
jgi:hypothetical protein